MAFTETTMSQSLLYYPTKRAFFSPCLPRISLGSVEKRRFFVILMNHCNIKTTEGLNILKYSLSRWLPQKSLFSNSKILKYLTYTVSTLVHVF